jgi:glycerol uptake facilitator protein
VRFAFAALLAGQVTNLSYWARRSGESMNIQPFLAELIGTAILIVLGDGVVANVLLSRTKGNGSGWIVIAFGWGMAVFVGVFCVAKYSGGHLNPAVTVAMAAAARGGFAWSQVPVYVGGQMLGAFLGAVIIYLFYREHFKLTADPDAKLGCFCTAPNVRNLQSAFFCEVVGTFLLVFPIFMMVGPSFSLELGALTKLPSSLALGALEALPVGLLVLAIGLSLGGTTGYAINPARDLGPRLAHALLPIPGKRDSDWGYAWVPVVGPLLGGLLAAAAVRALELNS